MHIPTIKELPIQGKKVLIRVDFNVPFNEKGEISDITKIEKCLPTIQFALEKNASVVLLSHLGRPKGQKNLQYTLKPCAEALSILLKQPVRFASDCLGPKTASQVRDLLPGEVLLLENLRFYKAEEHPDSDPSFAETLASYGEFYVNDAFASSHRSHGSITTITQYFPHKKAAGFLLEKEIDVLGNLPSNPARPFHLLLGGAKISSKLGLLKILLQKSDAIYIGGAMAFTFFKALNLPIGTSLFEPDLVQTAREIIAACNERKIPLLLPTDWVIAQEFSNDSPGRIIDASKGVPDGWQGMDIGPDTVRTWELSLRKAACIFWNGPVGVFEFSQFSEGTFSLARFLASLPSQRIIGGGDSVAAVQQLKLASSFTHLSTGGGAALEFIENGGLLGIDALIDR